jgi:hypothetical protein
MQGNDEAVLKPCPFCQGRAEVAGQKWSGRWFYGVQCAEDCGVWMDAREATPEGAIAAWNTRAPEPPALQSVRSGEGS